MHITEVIYPSVELTSISWFLEVYFYKLYVHSNKLLNYFIIMRFGHTYSPSC